jgi:hypothetical protein
MKKNLVCQEELDHKIWDAVSVIITRRNVECFLRPLISCFQEVANDDKRSSLNFFTGERGTVREEIDIYT